MKPRIGYFEVLDGCAGDMLVGSLIDAGLPIEELKKELRKIPLLDAYHIETEKVLKKTSYGHSLEATQFKVVPDKKWDDRTSYKKIVSLLNSSFLEESKKKSIKKIFQILANAESKVHKESLAQIHFHQTGQVDAIVEIASVVAGLKILGITKVYSSSIGVAKPAPATLNMLKDIPIVIRSVNAEITTPTGIAIIRGLCDVVEVLTNFTIEKTGYGAGEMDLPYPNTVKFFLGRTGQKKEDSIMVMQTNIDDMSPVFFERLFDRLFAVGVLDATVYVGIGKKNRPVFNLQVILPEDLVKEASNIIFKETSTLGIRVRKESRVVLERSEERVNTRWGYVRIKKGYLDGETVNAAAEYEDCKRIANKYGLPLKTVFAEISKIL